MLKKAVHVGNTVKEKFMKPNQLSLTEVASRIGMDRANLQKMLDGNKELRPLVAVKLARLFGKHDEYFFHLHVRHIVKGARSSHWMELQKIIPVGADAKPEGKKTIIRRKTSNKDDENGKK